VAQQEDLRVHEQVRHACGSGGGGSDCGSDAYAYAYAHARQMHLHPPAWCCCQPHVSGECAF
jgi:hypothetical protein